MSKEVMMHKYAVVDLEATGISSGQVGHIIQVGITLVEEHKIEQALCFDVQPPVSIQSHITELTGITNKQVKDAPLFSDIADYLYTLLEGCIFVAHNVHFDYGLLKKEFERVGIMNFSMPRIDTIELAKIIYPMEKSYGLKRLTTVHGILLEHEHNAGEDAFATAQLFVKMQSDFGRLDDKTRTTISDLLKRKQDTMSLFFDDIKDHEADSFFPQTDVIKPESHTILTENTVLKQQLLDYLLDETDNKHKLLEQHEANRMWDDVFSILSSLNKKTFVLVHHKELAQSISQLYQVPYFKTKEYYLDLNALEYLLTIPQDLTFQEVRYLCCVLVWLTQTQTGDLEELDFPNKFLYRLTHAYPENTYFFDRAVQKIKQSTCVVSTHLDFLAYLDTLKEIEKVNVFIDDVQYFNDTLTQYFKTKLYDTRYYQEVRRYMHTYQHELDAGKQEAMDIVLMLDKVLAGFRSFMTLLKKQYPVMPYPEDDMIKTVYIDKLSQIKKEILYSLKESFDTLKQVIANAKIKQGSGLMKIVEGAQYLESVLETEISDDYMTMLIKKQDIYMHYECICQKYTSAHFMQEHVYPFVDKLIYTSISMDNKATFDYLEKQLGDTQLDKNVMKTAHTNPLVPLHVLTDYVPKIYVKENLLVRKTIRLLEKLSIKNTVIIVPSTSFLEKVKEMETQALIIEHANSKKVWLQLGETSHAVYVTWHQWQLIQPKYDLIERAIIVRLPFEAPDSIQAQVSKHFLLNGTEHYFKTIALPKMIMTMRYFIRQMAQSTGEMIVLDERMINSPYQDEIKENLVQDCQITAATLETLLNQ
ncbi:hypothetical protein GMA11_05660 [Granulicatella sp. zg-ZJ]|nr:hypothetical protein [Granulicatella sp. zg-ZJ]